MSEQTIVQAKPTTQTKPQARGILQRQCACGKHTQAGEECEDCRKKREGTLQRAAVNTTPTSTVPPVVHDVLNSPGQSLDAGIQAFMEPRFGNDFSGGRVNGDEKEGESGRAVNGVGYTVGRDVVVGAGEYAPITIAGKRLLAHELTHVVQQGSQSKRFDTKLVLNTPADSYEQEADHIANLVTTDSNQPHIPIAFHPSGYYPVASLQRKVECSLEPIEKECNNATARCMTVDDDCKKKFPKPSDLDNAIATGKSMIGFLNFGPNAKKNFLHWLDNSGTEIAMPASLFENHKGTKAALLVHREKFIEGTRRRLESGELLPDTVSEQIVFTGHADSFTFDTSDDLAYAVGGFQLCSKVRVNAKKIGDNKFMVIFVEWIAQAFDCYNWDPGKGIKIPGLEDQNMCCVKNAGKAKHFRIHSDTWENKNADSKKKAHIPPPLPNPPL